MKNRIFSYIILPLCLLLLGVPSAVAQERMRVFFNSGNSLPGVVKVQTEDVIVLTLDDGATYQYPMSDIRAVVVDSLRRVRLSDKRVLKAYLLHETADKLVFIDPLGAVVQCDKQSVSRQVGVVDPATSYQPVMLHLSFKGSVGSQPLPPIVGGAVEGDLAIGYRDMRRRHFFVGIGVGYDYRFNALISQQLLPLFARMEYYFHPERVWSPFFGVDAGYSFKLKGVDTGGAMCNLSLGMQRQVGVKHQTFFLALFFKVQQCETRVSETLSQEVFYRDGTASLLNAGLRLGFTL